MNAKIGVLLSLSVVLLGSAAAIPAYPAPPARPAPSFGGTRRISAGQIYTSPNHTFTIVVPNCNPRLSAAQAGTFSTNPRRVTTKWSRSLCR